MHPLFYRLLDAKRTLGFKKMIWVTPRWLMRREYLVLVRDLLLPLPEIPTHESMEWTSLTEAEVPRVLAINPVMSEAEIQRRWREGQECLLCWIGGSLAHYRWDTCRAAYLPYLGKTLCLQQGDIHAPDIFTHPAFRGRGIHLVSSLMALRRARDLGFSRSITIVAWWNAPALQVNRQKTNRTIAGTVGYWNIGPWRYYSTTGDVWLDQCQSMWIRPKDGGNQESQHDT